MLFLGCFVFMGLFVDLRVFLWFWIVCLCVFVGFVCIFVCLRICICRFCVYIFL